MIPFSSFGTNSISWNSEEDLFSVQYENVTVKDILDYIEKHSKPKIRNYHPIHD